MYLGLSGPPGPPAHPRLLLPTFCPASFPHSLGAELGSPRCGRGAAGGAPRAPGPRLGSSCGGPRSAELCREPRPHMGITCGSCGWAGAAGPSTASCNCSARGPRPRCLTLSRAIGPVQLPGVVGLRLPFLLAVRCPEAPPSWCVCVLTWLLCLGPRRCFPREEVSGTFTRDVFSCSKASHGSCPHSWGPHTGWTQDVGGRGPPRICLPC